MSAFGSDVASAIALAGDEARMLGCATVQPEHVLLAILRGRRVRASLEDRLSPADVHTALMERDGLGDELVLGRVPRSRAVDAVLVRAIEIAGRRGVGQVENVHLLLALAERPRVLELMNGLSTDELAALVDEPLPARDGTADDETLRLGLVRAELDPPSREGSPVVPAFERFSADGRRAVRAAMESAALLQHREIEPFHVLIGCAQVPESFGARVLASVLGDEPEGLVGELMEKTYRAGPAPTHQATGRFSENAFRVVAQDALRIAYRAGHQQITTGHLLLAALDSQDQTTTALTAPHTQRLARSVSRGLPGDDRGAEAGEPAWIQLDFLTRILALEFRRVLPHGWTVFEPSRCNINFQAPSSRSESDLMIRPGWVVSEPGPAVERVQRLTRWMLARLQEAVIAAGDGEPWPQGPGREAAMPYAEVISDRDNPRLTLGYGHPEAPALELNERPLLLNMLIARN